MKLIAVNSSFNCKWRLELISLFSILLPECVSRCEVRKDFEESKALEDETLRNRRFKSMICQAGIDWTNCTLKIA